MMKLPTTLLLRSTLSAGSRQASTVAKARPRTLITGALGQLGCALARSLRSTYGDDSVVCTDIRRRPADFQGQYQYLDVLNKHSMEQLIVNEDIDWVVHFSALLSAVGEKNVAKAIDLNNIAFQNVIQLAEVHKLRVFCPSTIGAFGPTTPRVPDTQDLTIQRPETIYGVTKVYMELLGEYYNKRFGVDFRCLRLPGVISADSQPGGGTTDYAVDIFHHAISRPNTPYRCYLQPDARLPMIMLSDVVKAMHTFMAADAQLLKQRTYNLQAISFSPEEIAAAIRERIPTFQIEYEPDFRQKIAESWPAVLNDANARRDWGWEHEYSLPRLVDYMLDALLKQRANAEGPTVAYA